MEFEYTQLEESFKKLPEDIQEALTSTDISQNIKAIADKNGLLLDQASILFDLTSYVMLGLVPAKSFVDVLSKEAKIDQKTSMTVAEDINKEVFNKIKTSIQAIQEKKLTEEISSPKTRPNDGISSLETAGDFSIEKEKGESPEHIESFKPMSDQSVAQYREATLAHIEDPQPVTPPASSWTKDNEKHTEPLVDHLLSKPTSIPTEKIVQKAPEVPQKPIEPPKPVRSGPDPYREPVEE